MAIGYNITLMNHERLPIRMVGEAPTPETYMPNIGLGSAARFLGEQSKKVRMRAIELNHAAAARFTHALSGFTDYWNDAIDAKVHASKAQVSPTPDRSKSAIKPHLKSTEIIIVNGDIKKYFKFTLAYKSKVDGSKIKEPERVVEIREVKKGKVDMYGFQTTVNLDQNTARAYNPTTGVHQAASVHGGNFRLAGGDNLFADNDRDILDSILEDLSFLSSASEAKSA